MPKHAELSDAAWLADEYETNKRELTDIARDIGCTAQAVRYALKKFGIKIRPAKKKYPQLYDTDWMSEHYETKQLNSSQIAEIVGCDSTTVSKALAKLGIERRASGESIKLLNDQREDKSVYAELNDVDWLQQKYEVEGLSTKQITELVGARTPNSVRQALIRHGIAVRSVRDGWIRRQRDDGFKIDPSVLTGILLGDGGLAVTADAQESWPSFYVKHASLEHCKYVYKLLFPTARLNGTRLRYDPQYSEDGKQHDAFKVRSLAHEELMAWHERWYINEVKVVPKDFIPIDETVLLHWFLDDGTSSFRKRQDGKIRNGTTRGAKGNLLQKQVKVTFCSESFTEDEQQFLCDRFNTKYDLGMRLRSVKKGTGYRIFIPQSKTDHFFNVIGPCPPEIPSLAYKWK